MKVFKVFVCGHNGAKLHFVNCKSESEAIKAAIEESADNRIAYITDHTQDNVLHIYINSVAVFDK